MREVTMLKEQQPEMTTSYRILWQQEFGLNASYLTPKEIEILHFMAQGCLNKQIAGNLAISEQTAKNHVSSILKKLDSSNRTQAVVRATRFGIVSLV